MEAQQVALSALPPAVAHRIFLLLPVDQRARCATVCPGWRTLLADASLWTRLDLSDASGITVDVTARVLRRAAARAGGALETLDVEREHVPLNALHAVLRSNARTLRQLRTGRFEGGGELTPVALTDLLSAAPALRELSAKVVFCSIAEQAPTLLRNEPPYGPLRLHTLSVRMHESGDAAVAALFAALPAHASLRCLKLAGAHLQSEAVCAALVDAALAARLPSLELADATVSPALAFALARLLRGGTLTGLRLRVCADLLEAPAAAAALAAALQETTTLTALELSGVGLWQARLPGAMLLRALVGHPSLQKLVCCYANVPDVAAAAVAGEALRALVAADAPALTELDVSVCLLGDAALGPLIDALPRNTHLRSLRFANNGISEAFAAQRLLPAVRANASLRELWAYEGYGAAPLLAEAVRLVEERTCSSRGCGS
jgi:hypothetical protein